MDHGRVFVSFPDGAGTHHVLRGSDGGPGTAGFAAYLAFGACRAGGGQPTRPRLGTATVRKKQNGGVDGAGGATVIAGPADGPAGASVR